jgi:predicted transcriptional regulator
MSGKKQNIKIGKIESLNGTEFKIIKKLINITHHGQANWLLHSNLHLSISAVNRAVRELQDRGMLLKKRGYAALNPNIIKKLQEDD